MATSKGAMPPLAELLRWLAEMPQAFREEPAGTKGGQVRVDAVVGDVWETLSGALPERDFLDAFLPGKGKDERNRLLWVLAACHLLWHPSVRGGALEKAKAAAGLRRFLLQEMAALAAVVPAERLVTEDERREELVRRALHALDLRLPGESEAEARDRLAQVDSVEHARIMAEVAKRQEKLRRERELRRKREEEAASKMPRE